MPNPILDMYYNFYPEWSNQTVLHPVGLTAVIILGLWALIAPRRHAIVPFLVMACFIAPAQRVVVLTLDFDLLRLMVLFGLARLVLWNDWRGFRWKPLDFWVIAWGGSITTISVIQWGGDSTVLISQLGFLFNVLTMYFLFRCLLKDWNDLWTLVHMLVILSIPVAICFLVEKSTGRNMFAFLGGVPEFTDIRRGRLRCQGAFSHPITAGSFWAAIAPLVGVLWTRGGINKILSVVGLVCTATIVVTSASSTPLAGLLLVPLGFALFPVRRYMGWIVLGGACGLVALHLMMKAPVWHLLARIDLVGGSTGYYRYVLVNEFIEHFSDWWLIGSRDYPDWWKWGTEDLTNQYVVQGVHGGLITFLLFLGMIRSAFLSAGQASDIKWKDRSNSVLAWGVGVSMAVHCFVFVGVSYFGQIVMLWYLTLAICGSMAPLAHPASKRRPAFAAARTAPLQRPALVERGAAPT